MKNKKIISPLPIVFICAVLIVAVLNMNSFKTIYQTKIIDAKPINKQTALASIESEYTSSFAGKTNYIDINGLFSRMVDKVELNQRYKLNNGYLTDTIVSYSDSSSAINNITNLKKYLDLYEIPFAYVQTPHVIPTDDDEMIPFGYETHINGNSDRLLEGLAENGISYLDLRENFKEDGISNYDLYYSTDHHWDNTGSFLAHKYVVEFIEELLDENLSIVDYFDINNFNVDIVDCNILGSHGQRTGVYFGGVNKLSYIYPNFDTDINLNVPAKDYNKTGRFENIMTNVKSFSNSTVQGGPEGIYLFYNIDYRRIRNLNAQNDLKILVINDSFSLTLVPFLSLHFAEVHTYDVRTNNGGSTEGFIQKLHEVQPDFVLQVRITSDVLTADAKKEIQ